MNYEKNLFKTKFGRRILIIFIACTILPLLALSVFVYHQITSDLRAQTLLRLKQITKSISMSVFERLLFLEAEMQLIGSQFARSMPADSYQFLLNANKAEFNQFKAMAIYDDQGNRVTLFGDTGKFPEYALLDKRVSEKNKTTILTATENASIPTIFLAAPIIRTEHASRFMVGEASIENLSKILKENVIPARTGFLILDAAGNVLISSEKSDEKIVAMMADLTRDRVSGHFIYNFKNKKYLAEFRKLFLMARYSVPEWTIILTQADDNVLQSVNEFKTFFPLIILFSFLIILLLSIQFVRRSLLPLEKLKKGTQRIVDGNFDDKVTIGSGDEFDDLADSFNKMAAKLHQQFNELRLTAAIGQFSSMIQDPDKLLQEIMDLICKFLAFDRAALLLLNETKSRMIYKAGYGYTGRQKESLNITVKALRTVDPQDPIEQVLLTQKPQMTGSLFASESDRRASAKLAGDISPPTADNRGICIVVPIVYEKKSTGALLLEMEAALPNTMQLTFTPEFWVGLGSQIAVSLSNSASLQKIQESEQRFRKSFDHAASGICLISTDGQILTANNYLLKMLGYEEKELLAKSLEDISKQSHFMAEKSALKRLLKQEIEFDIYEKAFIHKKGHEIWGLVSISLLFNTSKIPLYYIMHIQNLSELKEAEKLQKELESRLREQQKKLHS